MRAQINIRTMNDDDPMSTSSSSEFRARVRRVCSLRGVQDVEKFLKKEELRYNTMMMQKLTSKSLKVLKPKSKTAKKQLKSTRMKDQEMRMLQRGHMSSKKGHRNWTTMSWKQLIGNRERQR